MNPGPDLKRFAKENTCVLRSSAGRAIREEKGLFEHGPLQKNPVQVSKGQWNTKGDISNIVLIDGRKQA